MTDLRLIVGSDRVGIGVWRLDDDVRAVVGRVALDHQEVALLLVHDKIRVGRAILGVGVGEDSDVLDLGELRRPLVGP